MTRSGGRRAAIARERDPLSTGSLRALRPWASIFADLPSAHLRVYGQLLDVLEPLLDTESNMLRAGQAEIDAYNDLTVSGPLERLIISELLWLKLMPAEFTRRLVEKEALLRRPEYQDRTEDRAVLLMLDSGPSILGRLRLVALAALLAIGSSAERRGCRLLWTSSGFVREPLWLEGITRRGLSRFINQISLMDMTSERAEALIAAAPKAGGEPPLWVVTHRASEPLSPAPTYHVELSERSVTPPSGSDDARRQRIAEATLVVAGGARRSAQIRLPDDQVCADILRAPFQVLPAERQATRGQGWAPAWMASEADRNGLVIRHEGEILLLRRKRPAVRLRLDPDAALLGVRRVHNGTLFVVWREDTELHRVKVTPDGAIIERLTTTLAADHPLVDKSHPEAACPVAMRMGRKSSVAIASPDGQLFSVRRTQAGAGDVLSVAPVPQVEDLRLLARARSWLLLAFRRDPGRGLTLMHARRNNHILLAGESSASLPDGAPEFEVINEKVGAIVAGKSGWVWIAPGGSDEGEPLPRPPVPRGSKLIEFDPPNWPRDYSRPISKCWWSAVFWIPGAGLKRVTYNHGQWMTHDLASPGFGGRVLAMAKLADRIVAVTASSGGQRLLVEFTFGSDQAPTHVTAAHWWNEAQCLDL